MKSSGVESKAASAQITLAASGTAYGTTDGGTTDGGTTHGGTTHGETTHADRVRLFTVFHHKFFDELYAGADRERIVLFDVNETYPKEYSKDQGYKVISEYKLPQYDPKLQQHGYCQTSAMVHVYLTHFLYADLDYVGFLQYDMKCYTDTVTNIQERITAAAFPTQIEKKEEAKYQTSPLASAQVAPSIESLSGTPLQQSLELSSCRHEECALVFEVTDETTAEVNCGGQPMLMNERVVNGGSAAATKLNGRICETEWIFHAQLLPVTHLDSVGGFWGGSCTCILAKYNVFFGTKWTRETIVTNARTQWLPILHTFCIPVEMFRRMMRWFVEQLLPFLDGVPSQSLGMDRASFVERCHALFLCLELNRPNVSLAPLHLDHIWPHYHKQTAWKNYKLSF